MSIKDRISAFERGGTAAPATPSTFAGSSSPATTAPRPDDLAPLEELSRSSVAESARRRAGSSASSSSGTYGSVGVGSRSGGIRPPGSSTLGSGPAISRTLSAGSLASNGSGQSSTRAASGMALGEMGSGQRPPPPSSPRLGRSEILSLYQPSSQASSSRPVSPSVPATSTPIRPVAAAGSPPTPRASASASRPPPPPLPQRQQTLPSASGSTPSARPPPPIAAKPAFLAKGGPDTPALRLQTSGTSKIQGGSDMISFSPVGGEPGSSGTGPGPSSNGGGRGHQPATSVSSSLASVHLDDNEPPPSGPVPAAPAPPALPSRKSTASSTISFPPPLPARKPTLPPPAQEAAPTSATRRQPPLPPKRLGSASSSSSLSKPRPANPSVSRPSAPSEAATARYSALFTQLLALRRVAKIKLIMAGKAAGWASTDEREGWLQGVVVREVWERSRLPADVLRDIWSTVDPDGSGSLDRPSFERGMGLIDEQLAGRRRAPVSRAR